MSARLETIEIHAAQDVVRARRRARDHAAALGFDATEQTRISTAVSELARNALRYAGAGSVELRVEDEPAPGQMVARVSDRGPGIADLDRVLAGSGNGPTSPGFGLVAVRRLADRFDIESTPGGGTVVEIGKTLPRAPDRRPRVAAAATPAAEPDDESRELLRLAAELRARESDIERLNQELDETNRGVVALYAELDDRAEDLRRASDSKSRFLSGVGHEFKTPLTSVLNLTRLLLDRIDGDLAPEQERQVILIRDAAGGLLDLVNDLLDLARIEAGKTILRLGEVSVAEMLGGLRGMFRPIATRREVALVFEDADPSIVLCTDQTKVAQILRNFVSNAIKFTPRGEVRVRARALDDGHIAISVSDTGVGIPPADRERIFLEFAQVEGPHQRHVRGTGLGLALSRRFAQLLGGVIELESEVGKGSTFTLVVPRRHPAATGNCQDEMTIELGAAALGAGRST